MLLTIILLVLIGGLSAILGSIVGIGGGIIIADAIFRSKSSYTSWHHTTDCYWYIFSYPYRYRIIIFIRIFKTKQVDIKTVLFFFLAYYQDHS